MDMCSTCEMISAVDPVNCWDDKNEDEKRPIMSSSKPKMSNVWQRFVDHTMMRIIILRRHLRTHLSYGLPRQCHVGLPRHIEHLQGLTLDRPSPPEKSEPTVANSKHHRSNSPGSNCSEETYRIQMEHELTKSELQQKKGSRSGRFPDIIYHAMACIDVIPRALTLLVTTSPTGNMKIGSHAIHVPKCVRWWALALDRHLWPTRIYMMRDGSVGHSNDPASSGNRPSNTDDEEVILDSGAEEHVTGNFSLLSRVTAVENGRGIVTASGHFMPALCSGSLIIDGFKVNDILFISGMTGTIFAVSKLDDLSYRTEFTGGECFVRDAATNALAGKGRRVRGLYKLDYLEIPLDRVARTATSARILNV